MSAPAPKTTQIQDNYQCVRCGTERTWTRPGKLAPKRPLIYCAKCKCIRMQELVSGSAGVSPAAGGVPPPASLHKAGGKSEQTREAPLAVLPANAVETDGTIHEMPASRAAALPKAAAK